MDEASAIAWLERFAASELALKASRAEPRLAWELHRGFRPDFFEKYGSGSALSARIPFANGYIASVQLGSETSSTGHPELYLGVACLARDCASSEIKEVFNFSQGSVRAVPPTGDSALETVCETANAGVFILALRQLEALPEALGCARRKALWAALELDDLRAAQEAWSKMGPERRERSPLGTTPLEQALGAHAQRCSRWLLEEQSRQERPWEAVSSIALAALWRSFHPESSGGGEDSQAPGLLWALEAGAPITPELLTEQLINAPHALAKALFLLGRAQAERARDQIARALAPPAPAAKRDPFL